MMATKTIIFVNSTIKMSITSSTVWCCDLNSPIPNPSQTFVIITGQFSADMNLTSFVSFHTVQVKFESRED